MDLLELLILLLLSGICATLAEWIVGYSPGSVVVSVIIGVVGAFLGDRLARLISNALQNLGVGALPDQAAVPIVVGGTTFPISYAILGSIVLVLAIKYARGPGRGYFNFSFSRKKN